MTDDGGFARAEYAGRLARLQRRMGPADLGAVLLTGETDFRYFAGFATQFWLSPTRPWFLILPATGRPVAVIPEIGRIAMARTWVEDIRTWPSPRRADDGITLLGDALAEVTDGGRIGLPLDRETHLRLPILEWEKLVARFGRRRFADATGPIRAVRGIKSPAEIARIRRAAEAAQAAFDRMADLAAPGRTDSDLFRLFRIACLEAGADEVRYLAGGAGRGGIGDVISLPVGRPLAAGDGVMLDTGCVYDGYYCDFDRNFALGRIDGAALRAYDIVHAATAAGIEAARPGATCREVFAAMAAILAGGSGDLGAVGRLGHGLGLDLTEPPSLTADDDTVLVENMVMTIEPGLSLDDGRLMVHEEDIVIRADGAELLTRRAPASLPLIGGWRG